MEFAIRTFDIQSLFVLEKTAVRSVSINAMAFA